MVLAALFYSQQIFVQQSHCVLNTAVAAPEDFFRFNAFYLAAYHGAVFADERFGKLFHHLITFLFRSRVIEIAVAHLHSYY